MTEQELLELPEGSLLRTTWDEEFDDAPPRQRYEYWVRASEDYVFRDFISSYSKSESDAKHLAELGDKVGIELVYRAEPVYV